MNIVRIILISSFWLGLSAPSQAFDMHLHDQVQCMIPEDIPHCDDCGEHEPESQPVDSVPLYKSARSLLLPATVFRPLFTLPVPRFEGVKSRRFSEPFALSKYRFSEQLSSIRLLI